MKLPRLSLKEKEKFKKTLLFLIIIIGLSWLYFLFQSLRTFYSKKENLPSPGVSIEVELIEELKKREIKAEIAEIKSDMIILKMGNGGQVILGKNKNLTDQIEALQLILNKDKMNEEKIKKIDLRFKNPVITF